MKKLLIFILCSFALLSCHNYDQVSDSGVEKAHVTVKTDANGNTVEQRNIMKRLIKDNEVGSFKHLYIISSYTGNVLEYSTVVGKVTSGAKRLSPRTLNNNTGSVTGIYYNTVKIDGHTYGTDELIDDGGAYGDSGNYLYWFDAQGNYQQYYPSGGTYLHIADKPLRIKKADFSLEIDAQTKPNDSPPALTNK